MNTLQQTQKLNLKSSVLFIGAGLILVSLLIALLRLAVATPLTIGYRDFSYGTAVTPAVTGEKPESKLWYNDGLWWGSLWDSNTNQYTIQYLDITSQTWVNTGVAIDNRTASKADTLWDGTHLYIVSKEYTASPGASATGYAKLYRFSYDAVSKLYSLESGFPVKINDSSAEALTIAKDSTGTLWVSWVESGKVKVTRSLGNDSSWGTAFDLPVQGSTVTTDDISTIIAMGSKVGILWSNQNDGKTYFAAHLDGDPGNVWQARENALAEGTLALADDHLNVKMACDGSGALYAVTKTSLTGSSQTLIYLLKRDANAVWSRYPVSTVADLRTRPLLLLDATKAYVFLPKEGGSNTLYMKSADLNTLAFPSGAGTPVIQSATDSNINNPTSAKHCVNSATGVLVLASDATSRFYVHNYLTIAYPDTTPPVLSNITAVSISQTVATITWDTNEVADSEVQYGTTAAYGLSAENSSKVLTHAMPLASLTPGTLYHYRVRSTDAAGNASAWSVDQTFTTDAASQFQCGNGVLESGEQCDGLNLAGASCASLGYGGGTLSCSSSCTYNTAACTSSGSSEDITTGLVAYYPLDANTNDASGNGLHGTATATSFIAGVKNNAVQFNGTSSSITIQHHTSIDFAANEDFTIVFWFKDQTKGTDIDSAIEFFEKQYSTDSAFYQVRSPNMNDDLKMQTDDGPNQDTFFSTTGNLANGAWHHVAFVRQYGSFIKGYVDGVEAGSDTLQNAGSLSNTANLILGKGSKGFYDGALDEFRIYTRALTQAEVLALKNADQSGQQGGGQDTVAPQVSVTTPTSGATVSGVVSVQATASDNVGVTNVQFRLDGVALGSADTSSPYAVSWDTTLATNGSHTLSAVAFDAAGNQGTSAVVSVVVENIAPPAIVLLPIADTYADASNPTTNRGSKTVLSVDGNPINISYMKFDLASLAGRTISSATLKLRVTNGSNSAQVVKRVTNNSWTESALTYKNRPSLGTTIVSVAGSKLLGTFIEIDITSEVVAKMGAMMSLGIDSTGSDGLGFYSKESATYKPELTVLTQ